MHSLNKRFLVGNLFLKDYSSKSIHRNNDQNKNSFSIVNNRYYSTNSFSQSKIKMSNENNDCLDNNVEKCNNNHHYHFSFINQSNSTSLSNQNLKFQKRQTLFFYSNSSSSSLFSSINDKRLFSKYMKVPKEIISKYRNKNKENKNAKPIENYQKSLNDSIQKEETEQDLAARLGMENLIKDLPEHMQHVHKRK